METKLMIKPSDLTWDEVFCVGAGTPGGNYCARFGGRWRLPKK
jgi:hypothetical protein